jgi:hypothetical protein
MGKRSAGMSPINFSRTISGLREAVNKNVRGR